MHSNGSSLRSLWSSRFRGGLSTIEVVATDNTQTEILKRPRENRCVINAPGARKLFHCQLPADGSHSCLDSPRRIGVLRTYPILKSRLHSGSIDASRKTQGKAETGGTGWKMSVKCRCPRENARKWSVFFHLERTAWTYIKEGRIHIGKWCAVTRAARRHRERERERQMHRRESQGAGNGEMLFIPRKLSV